LLQNIEGLDWTEKVKLAQQNWIGKKSGINIKYQVEGMEEQIIVFTTRPDTNFGATFIALAPEHPFVAKLLKKGEKEEIRKYVEMSRLKTEIERSAEGKEKTGVFTGSYCINPLTNEKMPIWISDFVLQNLEQELWLVCLGTINEIDLSSFSLKIILLSLAKMIHRQL
jgi:leucyl-tRNA synthetase